ncbi:hypothetical protein H696_01699, partial [Fonticula alba]
LSLSLSVSPSSSLSKAALVGRYPGAHAAGVHIFTQLPSSLSLPVSLPLPLSRSLSWGQPPAAPPPVPRPAVTVFPTPELGQVFRSPGEGGRPGAGDKKPPSW